MSNYINNSVEETNYEIKKSDSNTIPYMIIWKLWDPRNSVEFYKDCGIEMIKEQSSWNI